MAQSMFTQYSYFGINSLVQKGNNRIGFCPPIPGKLKNLLLIQRFGTFFTSKYGLYVKLENPLYNFTRPFNIFIYFFQQWRILCTVSKAQLLCSALGYYKGEGRAYNCSWSVCIRKSYINIILLLYFRHSRSGKRRIVIWINVRDANLSWRFDCRTQNSLYYCIVWALGNRFSGTYTTCIYMHF